MVAGGEKGDSGLEGLVGIGCVVCAGSTQFVLEEGRRSVLGLFLADGADNCPHFRAGDGL